MTNDELYNKALEAITELFSDQSVSQSECKRKLNTLRGEIDVMLDTLSDDDTE